MKKSSRINLIRIAAVAVLGMFSLATSSVAATKRPLNYPFGLTVDAKGNLYVANTNGNEVLVYNANHMQVPTKRISNNVSAPTAVAFDGSGNLWVANDGSQVSITQYSPAGVQNTNATLTQGLIGPSALAVDGLNDLWVIDDFNNLIWFAANQSTPTPVGGGQTITGVAAHQAYLAIGSNTLTYVAEISLLFYNTPQISQFPGNSFALAYDNTGNLYSANQDDTLTVMDPAGNTRLVSNLGFFPTGLALDNTRGLIYVANGLGNEIAVFSTGGTLVTTIK